MVELGVHNVEHRSMEVQEQIDYLKKDISTKMDKLVAIVRAHQEEMIQALENTRKDKLENLTFQLKLYETMMSQTESSFVFIEDLLQRNISEEILNVKNYVTSRVEEMANIEVGTNPAENEQVGYVPNPHPDVTGVKRGKTRASKPRLAFVLFLIGRETGASCANQSQRVLA